MDAQGTFNAVGSSAFHHNSNSLADFRSQHRTGRADFGQQQLHGSPSISNAPPGLNGGHQPGGGPHRRNGTAHASHNAILTRDSGPGTKNTSHVPCKFYKEGKCQAGRGCQFSHDPEDFQRPAPCKYFAKGNCKYGYRCANPHLMPDGRDARYVGHPRQRQPFGDKSQFSIGPPAHQGLAEHMPPSAYGHILSAQPDSTYRTEDLSTSPPGRGFEYMPPHFDHSHNTNDGLYGSSPNGSAKSPPVRAIDATIPPTFQSNPTANSTHDGPWPASFPARMGFGIGPSSATTSTETSNAFGNLGYMARPEAPARQADRATSHYINGHSSNHPNTNHPYNDLSNSPPNHLDPTNTTTTQPFLKRMLHSDRLRHHQNQPLASSLPMGSGMSRRPRNSTHHNHNHNHLPSPYTSGSDPDHSSDNEESFDLLPSTLGDDIMTPAEKLRRFSRSHDDNHAAGFGRSPPDSKWGSPSNLSGSPRNWGPLSSRKFREDGRDSHEHFGSSPHGPIGSPLRNSSLHPDAARHADSRHSDSRHTSAESRPTDPNHAEASPSIRPIARPPSSHLSGDVSPFGMHSPPGRSGRSTGGIGMLSQQLKNSRIRDNGGGAGVGGVAGTVETPRSVSGQSKFSNTSVGQAQAPGQAQSQAQGRATGDRATSASRATRNISSSRGERIEEESGIFEMDDGEVEGLGLTKGATGIAFGTASGTDGEESVSDGDGGFGIGLER